MEREVFMLDAPRSSRHGAEPICTARGKRLTRARRRTQMTDRADPRAGSSRRYFLVASASTGRGARVCPYTHRRPAQRARPADPDREALDGLTPSHCHCGRRIDRRAPTACGEDDVTRTDGGRSNHWPNLFHARARSPVAGRPA
jgi:hypothetical protein